MAKLLTAKYLEKKLAIFLILLPPPPPSLFYRVNPRLT